MEEDDFYFECENCIFHYRAGYPYPDGFGVTNECNHKPKPKNIDDIMDYEKVKCEYKKLKEV
jgi:hypothetical protein